MICFKIIITFLCFFPLFLTAESPLVGSLLVTYQTGINGERLDRIRFRIQNAADEHQLYPKPGGYVDDLKSHTRIVAVETIPVGTYILQFLVPNKDGLFDEIKQREITISENKTLKIDQQIRPKYASLKVKLDYNPPALVEKPPKITLFKNNQILISSQTGLLENPHLLPGEYTLTFEELDGYKSPSPIILFLHPKEEIGPILSIYIRHNN